MCYKIPFSTPSSFQNYCFAMVVLKEILALKLNTEGFTLKPLKISEKGASESVLFISFLSS